MVMSRQNFLTLMEEGLRKVFFLQYDAEKHVYPQIYDVEGSKKKKESYQGIVPTGMLVEKPEGEPLTYEDMIEGYAKDFQHTAWAKGIRITRELLDDAMYGVIGRRVECLARGASYRKEFEHAKLFDNASSTTYFTGQDGLALLSTVHTLAGVKGTTFSNTSASVDLSLGYLETAFNAIRRFVDDKNQLIHLEPVALLIPPELEMDAYEILKSSGKPYTADNQRNYFEGRLKVIPWKFIKDTNAWFVLVAKKEIAPISFNRVPVEFDRDGDFDTKDLKVSAYTRFSNGFVDPRFCYGSMGST